MGATVSYASVRNGLAPDNSGLLRCAIELPNVLIERNAGLPPDGRIDFGVGIHLGDVAEEAGLAENASS